MLSPHSITFHKVDPAHMYMYEYLLYELQRHGTPTKHTYPGGASQHMHQQGQEASIQQPIQPVEPGETVQQGKSEQYNGRFYKEHQFKPSNIEQGRAPVNLVPNNMPPVPSHHLSAGGPLESQNNFDSDKLNSVKPFKSVNREAQNINREQTKQMNVANVDSSAKDIPPSKNHGNLPKFDKYGQPVEVKLGQPVETV